MRKLNDFIFMCSHSICMFNLKQDSAIVLNILTYSYLLTPQFTKYPH